MRISIIVLCLTTAIIFNTADASGWKFWKKAKPKDTPASTHNTGNGHATAALNNHAHNQAETIAQRLAAIHKRELPGDYLTTKDATRKIQTFDGDWKREALIDQMITYKEGSPIAALKYTIEQDLISRGITIMPDDEQLKALKQINKDPNKYREFEVGNQVNRFLENQKLHRGFVNYQIERRNAHNIYDKVVLDPNKNEYESFSAVLDGYGHRGNDIYTPAPAHPRD